MAGAYTIPLSNGIRVRHDTQAEVTILDGRRVLQRDHVEADLIGAHLTVWSATHGGVSGYISWRDNNGGRLNRRPTTRVLFREADVLTGDQLCNCNRCEEHTHD